MANLIALISVFSGFLCLLNTSNAQPDIYCAPITRRPGNPRDLLPNQVVEGVPITRHHIIPSNVLIQFYNVAQEMSSAIGTSLVQQAIRHSIRNIFDSYYDLYAPFLGPQPLIRNAIANRLEFGNRSLATDDFSNILQQFVTWIPGNIFYGPTDRLRSDDSQDSFDENAVYILGETSFRPIRNLYDRINDFINDRDRSVRNFNLIFDGLYNLSSRTPTAANLDQWEQFYVSGGTIKFRIKKHDHTELRRRREVSDQNLAFINEQPICFIHTLVTKYEISIF